MKVLVTGGFGYVGSRLTPLLLSRGHAVRVLDLNLYSDAGLDYLKKTAKPEEQSRFEFVKGDLRKSEVLEKACQGVEAIIHLAAISNDPTGQVDETLTRQTNFDAVGVLVSVARKAGVTRFINASSSSVFGIKNEENVNEVLEPEPLTYYSKYKMLSEWIIRGASSPDFCTVNIRPATICGFSPRQRFDLTVNKLTADAVRKGVITVHGGEQRRPNVGMNDIIELYAQLLNSDAKLINGKTFNFGFENLKVIEIARVIQEELKELKVRIDVTSTTDNRDYHISSQKIIETMGYKPVSSIRKEVQILRKALNDGYFADIDSEEFYNMKSMHLERNSSAYNFLGK